MDLASVFYTHNDPKWVDASALALVSFYTPVSPTVYKDLVFG